MKVTITGNHPIDGVAPGGKLDVTEDRALLLARQGAIGWDEVDLGHVCNTCGFEAKTAGGLTSHAKTHDEED